MGVEGSRTDHADYGIDAPRVVRNATLAGSARGLLAPLLAYALLRPRRRTLAIGALVLGACAGLSSIVFAGSMLWSSSRRVSMWANRRRNP